MAVGAIGWLATDAVGVSLDELKSELVSELYVSQPAKPKARRAAQSANPSGFFFCQAAAASKVVTATLPRCPAVFLPAAGVRTLRPDLLDNRYPSRVV